MKLSVQVNAIRCCLRFKLPLFVVSHRPSVLVVFREEKIVGWEAVIFASALAHWVEGGL